MCARACVCVCACVLPNSVLLKWVPSDTDRNIQITFTNNLYINEYIYYTYIFVLLKLLLSAVFCLPVRFFLSLTVQPVPPSTRGGNGGVGGLPHGGVRRLPHPGRRLWPLGLRMLAFGRISRIFPPGHKQQHSYAMAAGWGLQVRTCLGRELFGFVCGVKYSK